MNKTTNIATGSPLGRKKTRAHRLRKKLRHDENVTYRAGLHAAKAAGGSIDKKAQIQSQIDEISRRK